MLRGAVLAMVLAAGFTLALLADASPGATCTAAQKTRRQAAVTAYRKRIPAERAAYFRTHRSAKARAAFVKKQSVALKSLQAKATCQVPPPSPPPTTEAPSPPIDRNPAPAANEAFVFGPGMPSAAQDEIKGDIAFAAEDEQRLVGLPLEKVTVFASTDATWLADQQCAFYGYGGDCVAITASRYASGSSTAQGGPGAVFIYWAAPSWQYGVATNQKILAHELFHVLQYQTDHLINAGSTPFDQIRPSGPVWLDEGAPEMVGYRVTADRELDNYARALSNQIAITKQINVPLSQLERLSQTNIPSVYSLFAASVDHLVTITPPGLPALASYYKALATGAAWPDAFRQAFGMSLADYYTNFADYRAKL